jgi:hypothetical protein
MILWRDPGREEVDQKAVPFLVSWKEIYQIRFRLGLV